MIDMAARKKQPKKKKPGPDPEVLKITGDAVEGFDKLVKAPPPKKDKKDGE